MPAVIMDHAVDPRKKILDDLGDISDVEVFNNQIMVAVYIRPEKTKSGLFITDNSRDEDRYQSKVGLIVKKGIDAFQDDRGRWFRGVEFSEGDWIVFRPSDGWSITVNGVLCRMMDDVHVRARVQHPDMAW